MLWKFGHNLYFITLYLENKTIIFNLESKNGKCKFYVLSQDLKYRLPISFLLSLRSQFACKDP